MEFVAENIELSELTHSMRIALQNLSIARLYGFDISKPWRSLEGSTPLLADVLTLHSQFLPALFDLLVMTVFKLVLSSSVNTENCIALPKLHAIAGAISKRLRHSSPEES